MNLKCVTLISIILYQILLSRMAQEGTPVKSSDESASEFSQTIFGAKNLEYQIEQFVSSGGQTVNILLSGKTGVGKSYLTNALIGENLAAEGFDIDPQTNDVSYFDIDSHITFQTIMRCFHQQLTVHYL